MEDQKNELIAVKDLILWTENPRDDISSNTSNEKIIETALQDKSGNWNLKKLAKTMGTFFDYSEIPTVVYKNSKPIVYDGNCRVILAMLKLGICENSSVDFELPDVDEKIPCNVCSETTALKSVYRKHSQNGSWKALERDKFLSKFMNESKSDFLVIDEATEIISNNSELNHDFVKNEILSKSNLDKLGLKIENNSLLSRHTKEKTQDILDNIVDCVKNGTITTRKNRGDILSVLTDDIKEIINKDQVNPYVIINFNTKTSNNNETIQADKRVSRRIKEKGIPFFGKKLILKSGTVNNLYRDIVGLYEYYQDKSNKNKVSTDFIGVIRMSLRLIVELSSKDKGLDKLDDYVYKYYSDAKKKFSPDIKTTLFSNGVENPNKLIALLNTGAHNYSASLNIEQAKAMSIIIGEMLLLSHGKDIE